MFVPDPNGEWYEAQKDLLPVIDDLKITTHQIDPEEPGACLWEVFGGYYGLEVSIEDKTRAEDIDYYSVDIVDTQSDSNSVDGYNVLYYSGIVFTTNQIYDLIKLIEKEDQERIVRLVHAKYYKWREGWVDTPEYVLKYLIDDAKSGHLTRQSKIPAYIRQQDQYYS